ncbi:acyl carrier protein [Streptomyces sp. NA02950]|uniref:acyl carrier protein n=1 Tax=Streptomyces sp. NA02950 TaxID=2742137 RepID=UPI00158FA301|nr:acyl carrier protein [Streptomyces sp. NA02950]QKV91488.1 acyl carrier protein [Streptomyces sp. NA02950]
MITPRLCGPAYELGEYADPVSELPELRAAPRIAADLTSPAAGFVSYRWSEAPVAELMTAAVQRTLAASGVPGGDIDMVLLATDSLPGGRAAHRDVAELLQETGMSRATVSTLGLMDCATAMAAVGTAASLVRDGTARQVMVVSGDLAELSTGGQRVVAGGAAIASDGAASALVSADAPGRPVLAMAHHADPEQEWGGGPPQRQLAARIQAYRELFGRLAARHPVDPAGSLVLPSHFARHVMRMYLADVGFPADRIVLEGVGRLAHCQGSDPLITLADLPAEPKPSGTGQAAAGRAVDPERLVLLGAGISHVAAVLLDARPLPRLEGGSS